MKHLVASALLLAFVVGMPVAANAESSSSGMTDSTAISCMKTAVDTREDAIKAGWTTFAETVSDAYSDRATALEAAYGNDTRAEVKSAVRAAWSAFKSAVKEARADWKSTRKDAWKEFKADKKECRAAKDIDDSSNESSEASS